MLCGKRKIKSPVPAYCQGRSLHIANSAVPPMLLPYNLYKSKHSFLRSREGPSPPTGRPLFSASSAPPTAKAYGRRREGEKQRVKRRVQRGHSGVNFGADASPDTCSQRRPSLKRPVPAARTCVFSRVLSPSACLSQPIIQKFCANCKSHTPNYCVKNGRKGAAPGRTFCVRVPPLRHTGLSFCADWKSRVGEHSGSV